MAREYEERFQAVSVPDLQSSFFWDVTERLVVAITDVSDTFRSHLRGPSLPLEDAITMEVASCNLPRPSLTHRANHRI
jgi:hypothetical protein